MARAVNPSRVYEDYDPPSDLVSEQGCDTILIYLPGYRKEQLRVQLTTSRILKITGERLIDNNKWRRFSKEFRVPSDCETKDITAKFEGGILYIRQPKVISPAAAPTAEPAAAAATAPKSSPAAPGPSQASELPHQPQPQPLPLPLPLPLPQSQTQPQPQQLPPLASPQPQTQQHDPRPDPQKGSEEGKKEPESCKKDEEGKGKCELKSRPREIVGGGFFTELSKPENCKRLAISVLVVLGIGFYATYMFKSFMEDDREL